MKTIKLALAALMISATTVSMAQKVKKTTEERVATQMELLNTKLGLNDAQSGKIKTALLERAKTHDEMIAKYGKDKKTVHENMKTANKTCNTAMMSTLTDEQKVKLKEFRKENKAKHKENKSSKTEGDKKATSTTETAAEELDF